MIKINFNQKLFDEHIKYISIKLKENLRKASKRYYRTKKTLKCLQYLSKDGIIEALLKANPTQLKDFIHYFKTYFPSSIKEGKELNKVLRNEIFEKEYNNWSARKGYGAYKFVTELDLKTCPYCNRNYTFIVNSEDGKLRPELDHFFPKSLYPFLAMSFYNLIPSCTICNHTKSNIQKDNLINPYDIKYDDISFTYIPNNIDFAAVQNEKYDFNSFEIQIEGNKENIELFKLEELYIQHKDIVLEILIKKAYYPESYIEELKNFGFNEDEIYRYLFSNYTKEEDLHKRPLSKLIKDISEELELI